MCKSTPNILEYDAHQVDSCNCMLYIFSKKVSPTTHAAIRYRGDSSSLEAPNARPDDCCRHHPQSRDFSDNPINHKNRKLIIKIKLKSYPDDRFRHKCHRVHRKDHWHLLNNLDLAIDIILIIGIIANNTIAIIDGKIAISTLFSLNPQLSLSI